MEVRVQAETIEVFSKSAEETFLVGELLGRGATGGEVVGLSGPLGAGKTVFVKGLAKGLEVTDSYVSSPTFILVHPHEGRLPLYHIDLYRLEKESEAEGIGLEEYLEGDGVAAVEWVERALHFLPRSRLMVSLQYKEGDRREIVLTASGPDHIGWLDQVKKKFPPEIEWKEIAPNG